MTAMTIPSGESIKTILLAVTVVWTVWAIRAFLDAVRNQENTPIDVYDVAAWMAVTCLSEQSIATGSMPIPFPDFTSGKWIRREPAPKTRWSLDEVYEECF